MSRGAILVVDDDAAIRETVADILRIEGYRVVMAANGKEALDRIDQDSYSLMVLDMRMPVLDGWGVIEALRARQISLPILVLTAARDAGRWAREAGVAAYLDKPFDLDTLLTEVAQLVPAAP